MKPKRSNIPTCVGIVAALLFATAAFASGYSPVPERRESLPSHKACMARLNATATAHRTQMKPRTFREDGGFQEIYLEDRSGGVKVTGQKAARYEARIWYHNGRLLEGGNQYEISHSWDMTSHECRGKVLIMNNARGYTLSTFEPVAAKVP